MLICFPDPALFVGTLKACLLAVGRDPARLTSRIRLEVKDRVARFVATDGHWLFVNELAIDDTFSGTTLHVSPETVENWVRMLNVSKKASTWTVEIDTDENTISQRGTRQIFEPGDDLFPPYSQIVPDFENYRELGSPALDARILERVMKAFIETRAEKKGPVAIQFWMRPDSKGYGHNKDTTYPEPVIVTASTGPALDRAMAIVMPMRASVVHAEQLTKHYAGRAA